ncbi:MAG: 30S ribosomal protein S6 [Myxococcales bacterium]|nr:30S ribosomal protein S6 [Myxococcales bacterium]
MSKTIGKIREYETVLIINPDLPEEAVKETLERFLGVIEKTGGTFLREDKWGKRKMAFEMKKNPRGHYILLHFVAEHSTVVELQRAAHNMDSVIRFMVELRGPVVDIEAKKDEVDKFVRERSAEKARIEAEKAEAAARAAEAAEAAQAAQAEAAASAAAAPAPEVQA